MTFFSEEFESKQKKEPRLPQSQRNSLSSNGSNKSSSSNTTTLIPLRLTLQNLDVSIERIYKRDYKRVAKTLQLAFNKDPFVNYILNTKINYPPEEKRAIKQKNDLFQAFFEYSVIEYFAYGGVIIGVKDVNFELTLNHNHHSSYNNHPFLAVACWNNLKFDNCLQLNYYNSPAFDISKSAHSLFGDYNTKFSHFHSLMKFNYFAYLNDCRQKTLKEKLPFLNNIRDSILINLNLNLNFQNKFDSVWYLSDVGVLPSMAGKSIGKLLINYCLDNFVLDSWCYLESSNIINRNFYHKLGFKIANTFAVNQDEIVNNIDIHKTEDLNVLNSLNDFILMDAMYRPPKNITIEKVNYTVSVLNVDESKDKIKIDTKPVDDKVPVANVPVATVPMAGVTSTPIKTPVAASVPGSIGGSPVTPLVAQQA